MKRMVVLVLSVSSLAGATSAAAAPRDDSSRTSTWASSRSIQDHFGIEVARQLVHADDGGPEDVLRGVDRAVAVGGPDGVALLVKLLQEPRGVARLDARVLLAVSRALAPFAAQRAVARALSEAVLSAPNTEPPRSDEARPLPSDPDRRARVELARETAALALARTGEPHATELLLVAARGGGTGQSAARRALVAYPPVGATSPAVLSASAIALVGLLRDLRAIPALTGPVHAPEGPARAAALRAAGALGDPRATAAAEAATHDPDPAVRAAATVALLDLGASEAAPAVRRLIEDDPTSAEGVALSERVAADEVVGALTARVRVTANATVRAAAIAALALQPSPNALVALRELMKDPLLAGDAAEAIARSATPHAWNVIDELLRSAATRRMGARMAAARGRLLGGAPRSVTAALESLARASDAADRAAGIGALALLGEQVFAQGLSDADPRVRRAAAMGCEPLEPRCARTLRHGLLHEADPLTRLVLARGLAGDGEGDALTTTALADRLRDGGVDAPVAALALARRGAEAERDVLLALLSATDPILRAQVARGLGASAQVWASPELAAAYEEEVDAGVRRTIVAALAERTFDAPLPARARALDRASRLDPDSATRTIADRALRDLPAPRLRARSDVVWLRAMDARGEPRAALAATLVRADGLALPLVFDEDGYAVSPAPTGPARLVLAPRLRAYEPECHGD